MCFYRWWHTLVIVIIVLEREQTSAEKPTVLMWRLETLCSHLLLPTESWLAGSRSKPHQVAIIYPTPHGCKCNTEGATYKVQLVKSAQVNANSQTLKTVFNRKWCKMGKEHWKLAAEKAAKTIQIDKLSLYEVVSSTYTASRHKAT